VTQRSESSNGADAILPLVIVNPRSAGGNTREKWSATAGDLRAHFGPFAVAFTRSPGHAAEIAERAARDGRTFIIACGGDGTINEVANGIIRSGVDTELGILPSGTGGDLRRSLGIPLSNREAAAALRTGETRRIDIGRVTFVGTNGVATTRIFLNVSSAGLAAEIIRRVKSTEVFKWLPGDALRGKLHFAVSTLIQALSPKPVTVYVKIDEKEERPLETLAFCVANSRYFGGGMLIAPDASLCDGKLDIINVGDLGTVEILLNAHTLYRGTHTSLSKVKSMQAKRVEIRPADPNAEILIETDGELPGKLPAVYEIVPNALRLRVPAKQKL